MYRHSDIVTGCVSVFTFSPSKSLWPPTSLRYELCDSCAVRAGPEEVPGARRRGVYGTSGARVLVRCGAVGRGDEAAGRVRHNPDGVAGLPRQLRLHGGADARTRAQTAPGDTGQY